MQSSRRINPNTHCVCEHRIADLSLRLDGSLRCVCGSEDSALFYVAQDEFKRLSDRFDAMAAVLERTVGAHECVWCGGFWTNAKRREGLLMGGRSFCWTCAIGALMTEEGERYVEDMDGAIYDLVRQTRSVPPCDKAHYADVQSVIAAYPDEVKKAYARLPRV